MPLTVCPHRRVRAGSLLGLLPVGTGFGRAEWVLLNSATIGMAGIGITVALALVRPWGMRIPGAPLAFCAWVGTGFLVPVLPYAVLSSLLGSADGNAKSGNDSGPSMPGWEAALIQIGFIGMGLGLAIALPAYLRRRWPDAFAGRLGDGGEGSPRALPWMAVVGAAVGLIWLYWAVGGTAGVAHRGERDLAWYVLSGVFGLWACVASVATWAAVRGRPRESLCGARWHSAGSARARCSPGAAGSFRSPCTWRSRDRPMRTCRKTSLERETLLDLRAAEPHLLERQRSDGSLVTGDQHRPVIAQCRQRSPAGSVLNRCR